MPDSLVIEADATRSFQNMLEASRQPELEALADTFQNRNNNEERRTVTRDEFISAFMDLGDFIEAQIDLNNVIQQDLSTHFDNIVTRFGTSIGPEDLTGVFEYMSQEIITNDEWDWIRVGSDEIEIGGQTAVEMRVYRTNVPKGMFIDGLPNDDDDGANEVVHLLRAQLDLDPNVLAISDEEIFRLATSVLDYPLALRDSLEAQDVGGVSDCDENAYYSTFDLPNPLGQAYDVICMETPSVESDGTLARSSGRLYAEWTTSPNGNNINDEAPSGHPNNEAETWGSWTARTRSNGDVRVEYLAILDLDVFGASTGTGGGGFLNISDGLANNQMENVVTNMMEDILNVGQVYVEVRDRMIAAGQTPSFDDVVSVMREFYDKEDSVSENIARIPL